jgi:hypothetical protein
MVDVMIYNVGEVAMVVVIRSKSLNAALVLPLEVIVIIQE